jgi:hypothetical protein
MRKKCQDIFAVSQKAKTINPGHGPLSSVQPHTDLLQYGQVQGKL